MSDDQPTVFVVDDDVSVRESLEALIRVSGWRGRTYPSAEAFLACPAAGSLEGPGCLVLDVSLPALSGLDLQALISSERREMPIIFITGHGDVPMTVQAMRAGALDVLTKPVLNEVLLEAIGAAIERSRAAIGEQASLQALLDRYALLSPREREVMSWIVAGLMNKQVAHKLGISEITVKVHRARVMEKTQVRSFAELVKMSERLGLGPSAAQ
jgi:FixJ family two-component response regulator